MKAVCWYGKRDVRVSTIADPALLNPHDAIVEVTSTAICGSDLHLWNGFIPTMQRGDVVGHEFMGRIVEVGPEVKHRRVGERVVVAFPIACGACWYCRREEYSLCDNTNPNATLAEHVFGHSPAGIFGYSHLTGGYAGGQAQYVRVPFADIGCLEVPDEITDDQAILLGDVIPTAWMAAEHGNIQHGDTVAIWGGGPVGQMAIQAAWRKGAARVIAIDRETYRLQMAAERGHAEVIDAREGGVIELLNELTGGRGPDVCIEAVGMEAHGGGLGGVYDRAMQAIGLESDRPVALREAMLSCRKGGTLSMAGVFGGIVDKIPFGAAFNKALVLRMGQTHVQRYWRDLLKQVLSGDLDPTYVITHHLPLAQAREGYDLFANKRQGCVKVVLHA